MFLSPFLNLIGILSIPNLYVNFPPSRAPRTEIVEDAPRRKSPRGGAREADQPRQSPLSRPLAPPHPKCYPSPRFLWPTSLQQLTTQAPGDQTSLMYPPQPPSRPSPPRRHPRGAGLQSLLNNPPYLPKSRPPHPSARPVFTPDFLFRRHSIRPAMHSINLQSNSINLQSSSIDLNQPSINLNQHSINPTPHPRGVGNPARQGRAVGISPSSSHSLVQPVALPQVPHPERIYP